LAVVLAFKNVFRQLADSVLKRHLGEEAEKRSDRTTTIRNSLSIGSLHREPHGIA
jgi:hypothetical protein